MPLHLYPDVYASGSVPPGWVPTTGGTIKYPVRNPIRHAMHTKMSLEMFLAPSEGIPPQQLAILALLTLGILESLANGILSATDALRVFFHAENCLYVRKHLRNKTADAVMSHGVQLSDLFEVLPTAEAHREFQRELATIRTLCLKLLEAQRLVA